MKAYESANTKYPYISVTHPLLERLQLFFLCSFCFFFSLMIFSKHRLPKRHFLFLPAHKFAYLMSKSICTFRTCNTLSTCFELVHHAMSDSFHLLSVCSFLFCFVCLFVCFLLFLPAKLCNEVIENFSLHGIKNCCQPLYFKHA